MAITTLLKHAAAACAVFALSAGVAQAQTCDTQEFGSGAGSVYLEAETELLVNENIPAALAKLRELNAMELNCYERGAYLRLSAAAAVESGDYGAAAGHLLETLNSGLVPADQVAQTYFNIGQLYLQTENTTEALDYMNRWIDAGGSPDRDQKWQLAILNQRTDNNRASLRWAREVFQADQPDPPREVFDFLIYLYDSLGMRAEKAALLEELLVRNPSERLIWDAIAGEFFQAGNENRAFEVQRAMYLGGILQTEDELMRVVNFYNQLDVPYAAARVLEKEMNAGRITKNYDRLELLANLYQVAREFEKAIPVIEEAARLTNSGEMYQRLGRSYAELKDWEQTEEALTQALNAGGLSAQDRSTAWVLIGQSRYERDNRSGARDAFREANSRGGRGWISFMNAEEATARALECFELSSPITEMDNEKRVCDRLSALPDDQKPAGCLTVLERLAEAQAIYDESGCANRS